MAADILGRNHKGTNFCDALDTFHLRKCIAHDFLLRHFQVRIAIPEFENQRRVLANLSSLGGKHRILTYANRPSRT